MPIYSLVCSAFGEDRQAIRRGARFVADIAHRYDLPVTWAIDTRIAHSLAALLTESYHSAGDDVLLMLDIEPLLVPDEELRRDVRSIAEDKVRMQEEFPRHIEAERDRLIKALPWAQPSVAGATRKNEILAPALQQVGFTGLWGYRWEQTDGKAMMDRGCPFGYFYVGKDRHNGPGETATDVVGIPYASVDLSAVLEGSMPYEASAEIVYALPRDIAGIPVSLWHQNVEWNGVLPCVQHISAEAVANSDMDVIKPLLEKHLDFVGQLPDVQRMTLTDVVADYRSETAEKPYTAIVAETDEKSTLFYYDHACQLVIERGNVAPRSLRNYVTPPYESRYCVELDLPVLSKCEPSRQREKLMFYFEIESTKEMPFGVAIWGDYTPLRFAESDAEAVLRIGTHLLLVRMQLHAGVNRTRVALTI